MDGVRLKSKTVVPSNEISFSDFLTTAPEMTFILRTCSKLADIGACCLFLARCLEVFRPASESRVGSLFWVSKWGPSHKCNLQ